MDIARMPMKRKEKREREVNRKIEEETRKINSSIHATKQPYKPQPLNQAS